jgi:hypothetical protein
MGCFCFCFCFLFLLLLDSGAALALFWQLLRHFRVGLCFVKIVTARLNLRKHKQAVALSCPQIDPFSIWLCIPVSVKPKRNRAFNCCWSTQPQLTEGDFDEQSLVEGQ